tara:strand:- start:30 stop:548 length:519 start_codon:yes stop_codon:yes gene_type:complete
MDFRVLKIENVYIDENLNISYINSKNIKKPLEISSPVLYLPFGIDKNNDKIELNLQLRKTKCIKHNEELKIFLSFLKSLENMFIDKLTEKYNVTVKSIIRLNEKYDPIINTKLLIYYKKIKTDVFKDNENYNFYKIEKGDKLKVIMFIDKLWIYKGIIYYKFKLRKIFVQSV